MSGSSTANSVANESDWGGDCFISSGSLYSLENSFGNLNSATAPAVCCQERRPQADGDLSQAPAAHELTTTAASAERYTTWAAACPSILSVRRVSIRLMTAAVIDGACGEVSGGKQSNLAQRQARRRNQTTHRSARLADQIKSAFGDNSSAIRFKAPLPAAGS